MYLIASVEMEVRYMLSLNPYSNGTMYLMYGRWGPDRSQVNRS